jgi:transposase
LVTTSDERSGARNAFVLACAETNNNTNVAAKLGIDRATIAKWHNRFIMHRLDGLSDEPRPGTPRSIGDDAVEVVIVKTLEGTPSDAMH